MVNGALFVMTSGAHRMLKLFAGSLDFLYQVNHTLSHKISFAGIINYYNQYCRCHCS